MHSEKKRRIVYTPEYGVNIGAHVFPTEKYALVKERLIAENLARADDFIEPLEAQDDDLCLVHSSGYVHKLTTGTLSQQEIMKIELPYSRELVRAFRLCAGGTTLACRIGLETGLGIHLGGGFHHAFPDYGEGFCVINDIAVGAKTVQKQGLVKKILIVDCDVHQGNGTAFIFNDDNSVFTFSIHQTDNYPFHKPPGNLDIDLDDGCTDEQYLDALSHNLPGITSDFSPDMIIYVAGADPYKYDQLGGLDLSIEGLQKRDQYILGLALDSKIPIVITLAGGYAQKLEDTVQIHVNAVKTALEMGFQKKDGRENE